MGAQQHYSEIMPPRRGAVIALAVDSTCRAYDMKGLDFGGYTPNDNTKLHRQVVLWMQAELNDIYFYFAGGEPGSVITTDVDDVSDTGKVAAGGTLAFDVTYSALLKAGNAPLRIRIDRAADRFIVVKTASTAGVLRFWAGSGAF